MLIKQFQQLSRLAAGRFALRESQINERSALWHGLFESACWCRVKSPAFELEQCVLMRGIQNHLPAIPAAPVVCDLDSTIENANGRIGSGQCQWPAHCLRWNGVVVEIETHIDGLA
jgi:hypothetical protein